MSSIKMKNNSKKSQAEALQNSMRAFQIWWKKHPNIFISSTLAAVFQSLTPYVTIYLSAKIINELSVGRNPRVLWHYVLLEICCTALMGLIGAGFSRWSKYEQGALYQIENKICTDKMLDMDFVDVDSQHVFDLRSQMRQNNTWGGWGLIKIITVYDKGIEAIIRILGGIALSVSLFVMKVPESAGRLTFLNHPICIVFILALMILIALLPPFCTNKANRLLTNAADDAKMGNRFFNYFGSIAEENSRSVDVRIYQQQENICAPYWNYGIVDWFDKVSVPRGFWMALAQGSSVVLIGVIYLFVCLKAWAGAFGVGSVTQYIGAITSLFLGISTLLEAVGYMQSNGEFLKTTFEFLDTPNKMYQGSLTTEKRADRQYEVEFRDVSFRYPGSGTNALSHVNMKFKVGSRLAVVGMNGSGKTTFIKLLCRLYDPTEGQILLNGIDIRKYRYDDYMNIFSVVFQDFKLLALPLGENVAGGKNVDRRLAESCLIKAGFGDRLKTMPHGLDTYLYKELSKDGVEVSGGEAQKIAIARALYKDAPFIILDEPTAALDPIAEAEIYSKFNDIAGDKTAIYISHRLSSCKFCDEIAVFDEGAVVQQGTHEQLLQDECGKYHELWHAQAQYYENEK